MWIDPVTGWEWHRHYWLVGEIEQVPPYEALLEMKSLLEVHQLRSAETVHCYRLTDVSRAPSRRYKSLQAALKGMQIGDVLIEGGDSYSASFSFALRLMIVRVPGGSLSKTSNTDSIALITMCSGMPRCCHDSIIAQSSGLRNKCLPRRLMNESSISVK